MGINLGKEIERQNPVPYVTGKVLKSINIGMKNNHSGIFNCESCDYSCENKQTFDNHMTRTHNPKNVVVKKRVWKKRIKGHFKCAHCTWTGSGLSKHWKSERSLQTT